MQLDNGMILMSSPSENITPEMGMVIGHALAMDYRRIVVAMDLMKSSCMMKEALIAGIMSSGADVIDIGVASGPVAAMAASKGDCAVYVTEYRSDEMTSGYVLINPDGSLFRKEQIRHLEKYTEYPPELPESGNLGHVFKYYNAVAEYNSKLMSLLTPGANCSIILDCECGPVAHSAPQVLTHMGADVLTINAQWDPMRKFDEVMDLGQSPGDVMRLVGSNPGSIGIALNRIGTMMAVVDEKGRMIDYYKVIALIVMYLKPSKIAVPLHVPSVIMDAFNGELDGLMEDAPHQAERKLETVMTAMNIGSVCEAVSEGAEVGVYETGMIFGNISTMPDGIQAAAIISSIARSNSLNKIVDAFPDYHRQTKRLECGCDPEVFAHAVPEKIEDLDGTWMSRGESWRVDMKEGWFLVELKRSQPPMLEVVAESKDRAYLIGLMEIAEDLIDSCCRYQ